MDKLIILFTSSCYLGYSPIVSGTVGTLGGVVLYLLLNRFVQVPFYVYAIITGSIFLLGIPASTKAENIYGKKDSGKIVIDEVVGFMVTMFAIPFNWKNVAIGFFLFRVLDVIKPFPIRRFEDFDGGFGVMADDFIAGIYGCLIMHGIVYFMS